MCHLDLAQHPNEHRPEDPILLAVDQQLGEGARVRVRPVGLDRADAVEAWEREDVELTSCLGESVQALAESALEFVGPHSRLSKSSRKTAASEFAERTPTGRQSFVGLSSRHDLPDRFDDQVRLVQLDEVMRVEGEDMDGIGR